MIELLLAGWCEPPDLRGLHLSTLVQQASREIQVVREGVALVFERVTPEEVKAELQAIAIGEPPDAVELAIGARNKMREKFDPWLQEGLLAVDYSAGALDMELAWAEIKRCLSYKHICTRPIGVSPPAHTRE